MASRRCSPCCCCCCCCWLKSASKPQVVTRGTSQLQPLMLLLLLLLLLEICLCRLQSASKPQVVTRGTSLLQHSDAVALLGIICFETADGYTSQLHLLLLLAGYCFKFTQKRMQIATHTSQARGVKSATISIMHVKMHANSCTNLNLQMSRQQPPLQNRRWSHVAHRSCTSCCCWLATASNSRKNACK